MGIFRGFRYETAPLLGKRTAVFHVEHFPFLNSFPNCSTWNTIHNPPNFVAALPKSAPKPTMQLNAAEDYSGRPKSLHRQLHQATTRSSSLPSKHPPPTAMKPSPARQAREPSPASLSNSRQSDHCLSAPGKWARLQPAQPRLVGQLQSLPFHT